MTLNYFMPHPIGIAVVIIIWGILRCRRSVSSFDGLTFFCTVLSIGTGVIAVVLGDLYADWAGYPNAAWAWWPHKIFSIIAGGIGLAGIFFLVCACVAAFRRKGSQRNHQNGRA